MYDDKVVAMIEEALRPPAPITPPAEHVVDVVEAIQREAAAQPATHDGVDTLERIMDNTVVVVEDEATEPTVAAPRVTAAWLIGNSSEADWSQYTVRLKQAEADAAAVQALLDATHASAQAQVQEARALASKALTAAKRVEQAYRAELQRQAEALDMQRAAELQLQADKQAVEHQAALRDAMEQHAEQVDGLREQLNALSAAFSRRSEERRSSHSAHKLALASMALDAVLDTGGAFDEALHALRAAAGSDAMAACVLDSLAATGAAQHGVPTELQLLQQFRGAKRRIGELMLVPAGGLGPVTVLAAKVASLLRVDTGDDALSRAEALVANGELNKAATLLEVGARGTAAQRQIGPLVESLRLRSAVQLASSALAGRARALTVSLA